jgi:hypothetical protein
MQPTTTRRLLSRGVSRGELALSSSIHGCSLRLPAGRHPPPHQRRSSEGRSWAPWAQRNVDVVSAVGYHLHMYSTVCLCERVSMTSGSGSQGCGPTQASGGCLSGSKRYKSPCVSCEAAERSMSRSGHL